MKQKYLVVIEKADNNYSAFSPDVEGCIATGDTVDETIRNMKEALEFHLEALDEMPEPKGLKHYIDNKLFDSGEVDDSYLITNIKVELNTMV